MNKLFLICAGAIPRPLLPTEKVRAVVPPPKPKIQRAPIPCRVCLKMFVPKACVSAFCSKECAMEGDRQRSYKQKQQLREKQNDHN